jgi:hypothetical protein
MAKGTFPAEVSMSDAVRKLLDSFDVLPEDDQRLAAVEILRRVGVPTEGDLPDSALVEVAEELFRTLDAEEGDHA